MQRWMFQQPERAAQLPALVPVLGRLVGRFAGAGLPIFDVRVIHKADRSTWSRLMLKYGLDMPPSARFVPKRATARFSGPTSSNNCARTGSTAWLSPALSSMAAWD